MAYQNFIPTVWNEAIDRELERLCVFAEDCNRKYEGKVKEKGESVKILGVGKPTIKSIAFKDKNKNIDDAEEIEDTSIIMQINQIRYFNYKVGDIDKAQAVGGVMEALQAETSEGLANEVDTYIAGMANKEEAVKLYATAPKCVAGTASTGEINVLKALRDARKYLTKNDVKQNTKIVATVDADFEDLFVEAYTDKNTNNSDNLKNGAIGMYHKMLIKSSNNVATDKSGNSLIMVRTQRAIAYVKALTHTEAYRPEKGFADAVKGFILFDAKIVRPKEMVVINVNY
jgi:hypothetical protein|uniref:Major capsid protein n=1 Tax=Myoviridae sp. ctRRy11 TaxID=2826651 RepID=A0A8S5MXD2_9CAUD|nr:MAG TPA: Major capsid protein [Myoviridae sp. ctRRy11]